MAMRENFLSATSTIVLSKDAQTALDKLQNDLLRSLEPPDLNNPVPASDFKALIRRVSDGIESRKS